MPDRDLLAGPATWAIFDKTGRMVMSFTTSTTMAEKYHGLGYRVVPSSQVW